MILIVVIDPSTRGSVMPQADTRCLISHTPRNSKIRMKSFQWLTSNHL